MPSSRRPWSGSEPEDRHRRALGACVIGDNAKLTTAEDRPCTPGHLQSVLVARRSVRIDRKTPKRSRNRKGGASMHLPVSSFPARSRRMIGRFHHNVSGVRPPGSGDPERGSSALDLYLDWITPVLKSSGAPVLFCGSCRIESYDRRRLLPRPLNDPSRPTPSV